MRINRHTLAAGTAMVVALGSTAAYGRDAAAAQEAAAPPLAVNEPVAADDAGKDDIVVTGTSIRGLVKPVGASTVAVDREEVKAQGVTSTVDLLANIPQIRNFGGQPAGQASATQSFAIPALRNLPNTQPGDGTLFLWNGNRMVGGGFSTRPDPAVIPTSAIDRVEVVLGGGSAIYGSDAVAGTINFVVRKSLDGVEMRGTYGFADSYSQFNINGAWGKVWDTGNVLIAADFSGHSAIRGSDRDYVRADLRPFGGSDSRLSNCPVPNVTIGSTTYGYAGSSTWGPTNRCDPNRFTDIYPHERRWSVFASFNQQIADNLEFGVEGYYARRTDQFIVPQISASGKLFATGPRANPYFQTPVPGTSDQTVNFNFASVFGDTLVSDQDFTTWQIMPSLKWTMGGGWRAVATFNYGFGDGVVHQGDINPIYQKALDPGDPANGGGPPLTPTTALNPFDLSQTNAALLAQIRNWNKFTNRYHTSIQSKIVLDGPLFAIGGGDVKLAVGGERYWEDQYSNESVGPYGAEDPNLAGGIAYRDRTVYSAFAELVVPVFSDLNAVPGFHSLTFNVSGRYDHYSDFGSTFNPKFAGTWSPLEGLSIRGSYSTAFVAPSLNSMAKPPSVQLNKNTSITGLPSGLPSIVIQGGNPGLKPETAKTFDVGVDLTPPSLPGFKASLSYYRISMKDVVAGVNVNQFLTIPGYAPYYLRNPGSVADITGFRGVGSLPVDGGQNIAQFVSINGLPQIVVDSRTQNLGQIIVSGLDYAVQYRFDTDFGTFTPAIAGTHGISLQSSLPTGSPYVNLFNNGNPRDTFTASLNYANGPVKARASLDYLGGFPVVGVTNQAYVDSFKTVNLYLSYELPKRGILEGTTISVNLDNIFNEEPSYRNIAAGTQTIAGVGQGSFIGRFFSVSLEKKF